jgi:hypothetical protein
MLDILLEENNDLPTSLNSHFIDGIEEFGISSDDYNVFLEKRGIAIYEALKNRIELKNVTPKKDDEIT